jgi:hypothetical protein
MRCCAFALLCAFGISALNAAETAKDAAPPQTFIVGLSPFLEKGVKDDVYRSLVRLLVEDLPLNSTVAVYDAFELKTITQVSLPNVRAFNSPKTRANQFASAIRDVKEFLAREHIPPTNSHLRFEAAVRLPQFLDFLAANLPAKNSSASVLLFGSPLYQDAKEPAFSMVDGYFPSDGHLLAAREKSIFGMTTNPESLPRFALYWAYFGDPWVSELHKEKVTRFWTLYLERRAAQMGSFSSDVPTTLHSYCQATPGPTAGSKGWAVAADQDKIEMLRVSRGVEIADWLTRDTLGNTPQGPPAVLVGPMKIGIRWSHNIDLDLYATPRPGAETLYFEHLRSPEGYYYKDHRSSPGREYEFIEFDTPVNVREVQAFVNFYKGRCPGGPRGEVRIEFDGRIYGGPFSLSAEEGNLGRSGRSQEDFWTRIPVQEILKLTPAAQDRAGR